HSGAFVLCVAFLVKAGAWPLSFWLPPVYSAAAPPNAAVFVILSKVGFYAILRLQTLMFGDTAGASAHIFDAALLGFGLATLAFGTVGLMSSKSLSRVASYYILVSSGTLLTALAIGGSSVIAAALFYLIS